MNNNSKYLAIILAAGKGSRLAADIPKPLYKINDIPIIDYIINSISSVANIDILTVVGLQRNQIINHIKDRSLYLVQKNQNGTGGAVLECMDYIKKYKDAFIFVGDAPFVKKEHILKMISSHQDCNAECSFLYSKFPFELPYARLIFNHKNKLTKLIESSDLNDKQKHIKDLFTSQYLFKSKLLLDTIDKIKTDNRTGEYNFTEIINLYIKKAYKINPILVDEFWSLMGVNTLNDIKMLKTYTDNDKS